MTDRQIICEPSRAFDILADSEQGGALRVWLLAHGIDPYDVPADALLTIETHPVGGPRIHYEVFLKDHEGRRFDAEEGGPSARERRSCALLFQPSPCLLPAPPAVAGEAAADAGAEQPGEPSQ